MLKNKDPILIIGAGLSGLSTGYHLKRGCLVLEKESYLGGMASSEHINGFTFDKTGHLLHFQTDYVKNFLNYTDNAYKLLKHRRSSWIFSKNTFTRYPFQANTYHLPSSVIKECLISIADAQTQSKHRKPPSNFQDWILANFGEGIAKHFMFPYNRKLWKTPLNQMSISWANKFIPNTGLKQAIKGAVSDYKRNFGYNKSFYYPERKGIQVITEAFTKKLKKQMRLNSKVVKIDLRHKKIIFSDGKIAEYDILVSTIPLLELVNLSVGLPKEIADMSKQLKWVSVFNLNLGIRGEVVPNKHWVYFPESKYIFYRVGISSNFSKHLAPKCHSSLYTEVSYTRSSPLKYNRNDLKKRIIQDLKKAKLLKQENDIALEHTYDIKYAYPIQYKQSPEKHIKDFLKKHNIYSIGRYGGWEYTSMEENILEGKATAEAIDGQNKVTS